MHSTNVKIVTLLLNVFVSFAAFSQNGSRRIAGLVVDPVGRPVAESNLEIASARQHLTVATDSRGAFHFMLPETGDFTIHVEAAGFAAITKRFDARTATASITLHLEHLTAAAQQVIVTAHGGNIALDSPDPGEKIMVREELLDANPGRPGAPVSIPGMPIETASGGIKAPQYFVPGVAGDHGEPIAQYIIVGGFLVPNNLSANAHGNGYADPNIYISAALGSMGTDGGAYNALKGNHALNMAATYSLRPQIRRFITLTGDYRDADIAAGLAPSDPAKREWLALEANYGNGLMRTLEHRKQFKWNAMRVFNPGNHEITLLSIGYWGHSHEGNLVPIGYAVQVNDTLDPRQQDQTHTGLLAANDRWKTGTDNEADFSGYIRTYNLALFSNFGEGLIRQSEFRTVEGGEARERRTFKPWIEGMVGVLYNEDDIRNDDLDHYLSPTPSAFGAFVPVLGNNVTIRELAPYAALHGGLGQHIHLYGGLRNDQIEMKNVDKFRPQFSFDEWEYFENPKATATWTPGNGPVQWLPSASFSIGQAFFTEDPRIELATSATAMGSKALADPFERSHAEQLVLEKQFSGTDMRVTAGRTTMTATLAKIDPDNGSAEDLGPSTLKFLTASAGHQFSFGTLQAVFSKADAHLATFNGVPGTVVPEAPRTIFDALTTLDRLPWGLRGRGEYEYVGHKFLDVGNSGHSLQYEAIPVDETRLAIVRPFLNGRLELGADSEIARGYTGQTTETIAPEWKLGQVPYCAPRSGPTGDYNDFDCGTNEQAVGIRMVSWVGGSASWRFGAGR